MAAELRAQRVAAEPPSSAPAETSVAAEEFDHEIANIYSEEATELIEAAEISLTAWNRDRKDKERVAELQRQLHTLKGGARMAGITAMGDLSHELESLVIQIDGGAVAGDDHAHAVMQASLDELARMRDMVSAGDLPSCADGAARAESAHSRSGASCPKLFRPAPLRRTAPAASRAARRRGARGSAARTAGARAQRRRRRPRGARPRPRRGIDASAVSEESVSQLEVSSGPVLPGRESRRRSGWKWRASMRSCSTPCSTTRAR